MAESEEDGLMVFGTVGLAVRVLGGDEFDDWFGLDWVLILMYDFM